MAKFYGIGTGPGDSSLLTIKAVETIIESEGIETEVHLKGLGEIEKIQQKFVQHALEAEEV